ncbi:MAG TPA: hypothetical protein VKD72_08650 [Gemmataceae bacterium]|nr:hypothetical protein [Gemmataceae bacterium]
MAARELHGFGAFFFALGIVLLAVGFIVGMSPDKDYQVLAAGVLIGLGLLVGLCFVAAAITYAADQQRRPPKE